MSEKKDKVEIFREGLEEEIERHTGFYDTQGGYHKLNHNEEITRQRLKDLVIRADKAKGVLIPTATYGPDEGDLDWLHEMEEYFRWRNHDKSCAVFGKDDEGMSAHEDCDCIVSFGLEALAKLKKSWGVK